MVLLDIDKLLILRNIIGETLHKLTDPLFFLFDVARSDLEIFRINLKIIFLTDEFGCLLFELWGYNYGCIMVRFKCDIEPLLIENLFVVCLHQNSRGVEVFLFAFRVSWFLTIKRHVDVERLYRISKVKFQGRQLVLDSDPKVQWDVLYQIVLVWDSHLKLFYFFILVGQNSTQNRIGS